MEKERETARMEAKRRKLMEKKVREHGLTRFDKILLRMSVCKVFDSILFLLLFFFFFLIQ